METATQTKELITIDASQFGVEKSKAEQLESIFSGLAKKLNEFEQPFNEIIQESESGVTPDLASRAKRLRLDIGRAVRIPTEKARKEEKADIVRRGKAIDGLANIIKDASYDFENPLKKIEDHAEIMEQKRLEKLQEERASILSEYVDDANERDLSGMDEDVWSAYLSAKKKEHEDRLEAERKAEQERIEAERKEKLRRERERQLLPLEDFISADLNDLAEYEEKEFSAIVKKAQSAKADHEKEQEKIRKENERLKKEREEAAKKAEAERKAREEKERKEKVQLLLSNGFELSNNDSYIPDEQHHFSNDSHVISKDELDKVSFTELTERVEDIKSKAKAEAERKEKERLEAEAKERELAPEKERLQQWVDSFELPEVAGKTSEQSEKVIKDVTDKFNSFKVWAKKEINSI